jgi:toxin-antitoxin system PIN domain toxin
MSATVDANVLVYASDRSSRWHSPARESLESLAAGPDLLYVFWPVVMSYLRISTHPAIFDRPLSEQEAIGNISGLLEVPYVRTPGETDGFWDLYLKSTEGVGVRGNLVSDAHLATLMRQNGVRIIWTHDRDFRKFEGITVRNPFEK